jgi:SagB-type dehydrogenase family enzyme
MFDKKVTLAEDYHFSSRNNKAYKFIKNEHLVHYREDILKLKNKSYVETEGEGYPLPAPSNLQGANLLDVLFNRKSRRNFDRSPMNTQSLADILYYSNGYRDIQKAAKFVPSSGGLNSVDLFVIMLSSEDLPQGIYHYDPKVHKLISVHKGNFSTWVQEHVFYQEEYADASCIIVLTSMIGKLSLKYGLRSYRLSFLDVGHVSQNIYLLSSAHNVKCCASAGFIDDELDQALNLDGFNVASLLTIMLG